MTKKLVALLLVALAISAGVWLVKSRSAPAVVRFAPAVRETLADTLATNGKVEPVEWWSARAERDGPVLSVPVREGQAVAKGSPLAEIDSAAARAELTAAESRIVQARAELAVIQEGGRPADIAEIEGSTRKAELELRSARREAETLERLVQKKAATRQELLAAMDRLAQAQTLVQSLAAKRRSLVSRGDRSVAEARLKDAETAAELARNLIAKSVIRAPMAGTVYGLDVRAGAFLSTGDEVARIGKLDRMKVVVYVDEPELGRVRAGMPVVVTWDASPSGKWTGLVERVPTQVIPLGTRQVGEVICTVDNPGKELLPGTNINASIRAQEVQGALTIPKEAVRREGGATGVYVLEGDRVAWRAVKTAAGSITRVQVLDGLKEGDRVALPTEKTLKNGDRVQPQ